MSGDILWPLPVLVARLDDVLDQLGHVDSAELSESVLDDVRAVRDQLHRHAAPARTAEDLLMIGVAKRRGLVRLRDGSVAVLVAWRFTGHRNRARVEVVGGEGCRSRARTVPCSDVLEAIA